MEIARVNWSNEFEKFNLASTDVPQIQIPTQVSSESSKNYTKLMMHLNLERFHNALLEPSSGAGQHVHGQVPNVLMC